MPDLEQIVDHAMRGDRNFIELFNQVMQMNDDDVEALGQITSELHAIAVMVLNARDKMKVV